MMGRHLERRRCGGFTLLEVAVAAALAAIVGLSVVGLVRSGRDGAEITRQQTMATGSLRKASVLIAEDLEQSQLARMAIVTLADKNHQVTFQRPVACVGGATTWGAYDGNAATDERLRAGCFARYTVIKTGSRRDLVRQLLAADQSVLRVDTVVRGVASGSAANPGFACVLTGVVWRVTVGLAGTSGTNGQSLTFDVALRN